MRLDSPLREIKGIGEKTEKLFQTMGVYTVGDILLYFPRDYEKFPEMKTSVDDLIPNQKQALYIRVTKAPAINNRSKNQIAILDIKGLRRHLRVVWFRMPYIRSLVRAGQWYVFYGQITEKDGFLYLDQPQIYAVEDYEALRKTLQPIYSLTKGITNKLITKTIRQALEELPMEMEYLPEDIRGRRHLSEYNYALENIHFPRDEAGCIQARKRFVFDEFFFFILCMQLTKDDSRSIPNQFFFQDETYVETLVKALPYTLTGAQQKVLGQVIDDLKGPHIMQRLVQGDVGSGKTIIAFLAMIYAAHNGYQAAIMAPTDVLARQHYQKLCQFCQENQISVPVVLLTGSLKAGERREAYARLEQESPLLIVGTHALIQEKVTYNRLALVITDEQHRFGVRQRETFSYKGDQPHILVMSATPIPRTLAIILYGDLDISVMDEVPARRKPIKNCVVTPAYRNTAYKFLQKEINAGHQCYVICPLVEASEQSEGENVLDYAQKLTEIFPETVRVAALHGRMRPEEKNRIMESFLNREIQILVSTTVIEVGVDVPNATVMMIENADRFGLAQLHQLRGRVGRGDAQSYCILINGNEKSEKNKRLEILNKSNDGFYIASEDLKLRGPGDFFGIRQSGDFQFRLADIYQDADVMEQASEEVARLLADDSGLKDHAHDNLRARLKYYAREDYALLNL